MPALIQDLTEQLLRAIDPKGNVVDMAAVEFVVNELEKTQVTAEDLKSTRLGRYINMVRRKINNKQLARRMKKLVKQWLQQAGPPANGLPATTPTSMDSTAPSPLQPPARPGTNTSTLPPPPISTPPPPPVSTPPPPPVATSSPTPPPSSVVSMVRNSSPSANPAAEKRKRMRHMFSQVKPLSTSQPQAQNSSSSSSSSSFHPPSAPPPLPPSSSSSSSTKSSSQPLIPLSTSSVTFSSSIVQEHSLDQSPATSLSQSQLQSQVPSTSKYPLPSETFPNPPPTSQPFPPSSSSIQPAPLPPSSSSSSSSSSFYHPPPLPPSSSSSSFIMDKQHDAPPSCPLSFSSNSLQPPSATVSEKPVKSKKLKRLVVSIPRHLIQVTRTAQVSDGTSKGMSDSVLSSQEEINLIVSISTALLPSLNHEQLSLNSKTVQRKRPTMKEEEEEEEEEKILAKSGILDHSRSDHNGFVLGTKLDSSSSVTSNEVIPRHAGVPPNALLGVDGCVGVDGLWYSWVEAIPGDGSTVTVYPYVYIDGLDDELL